MKIRRILHHVPGDVQCCATSYPRACLSETHPHTQPHCARCVCGPVRRCKQAPVGRQVQSQWATRRADQRLRRRARSKTCSTQRNGPMAVSTTAASARLSRPAVAWRLAAACATTNVLRTTLARQVQVLERVPVLVAESQDRINWIDMPSKRWCACCATYGSQYVARFCAPRCDCDGD